MLLAIIILGGEDMKDLEKFDIRDIIKKADEEISKIDFSRSNESIAKEVDIILYDIADEMQLTAEEFMILKLGCIVGEQISNRQLLGYEILNALNK